MPSRAGPCERIPVSLKGLSSSEIRGHFSFLWPVLEGVFQLAHLGPSNYPAAASGNDRPAGSRHKAATVPGPRLRPGRNGVSAGISVCRARVGPRTRELGRQRPSERTRVGPETFPTLHFRGPHPLCRPKNKARRRPVPGPPRGQVSGGLGATVPTPPIMRPRPSGASLPALPPLATPALRLEGLSTLGSLVPSAPLLREGEAHRCRRGLPAPLLQPPQQWRAGPQRPGRPPPGSQQVREGAAAGSRRRPAPPRPLPAGGPRPARRPRSPRFGPPPRVPSCFQNPPGKAPRAKAPTREIAFRRLQCWAGAPHAVDRGRGPRGSGAGSNPRPPPPARPPVCLSDVPALPAAAAPSLLPAPRRAVGPTAAVRAPRPPARRSGTHAGMPTGRQDTAPRSRARDTGARASTRRDPDARRPQKRRGSIRAQRHADHKHREGHARVCESRTHGRAWPDMHGL